jgi:hypothetical protein
VVFDPQNDDTTIQFTQQEEKILDEMKEAILADALKHNQDSKYVNGRIWFNKECSFVVLESHIKLSFGDSTYIDLRLSSML